MPQPIDAFSFRLAFGAFATGVTVITTRGPPGGTHWEYSELIRFRVAGAPLVLWSLSRTVYSFKAHLAADHFAVNVLRNGQEDLPYRFAKSLGEKWRSLECETWETGCPILPNVLSIFECKTAHTYQGGEHVIFVGEVTNFDCDPYSKPPVFWQGGYHREGT